MTRCKVGDLAAVIRADAPENIGVLVTVLAAHTWIPNCWYVQVHGHAVAANHNKRPAGKDGRKVRAHDADLRPIRDPGDDAVDETLQRIPSPVETA